MAPVAEHDLWHTYAARVRAYGLRHLRDATAAQDLVQHVLLAVLQALRAGRVADLDRLDAYVLGTCRNSVMDFRRGAARRDRLAAAAAGDGRLETAPVVDRMRLEQCVAELAPRDRAVVLATFVEDRDADEIAGALALTAGNVRVIRHRALARLLECLERRAS